NIRLEVVVVAAFEEDLHRARAGRLDLPPADEANRGGWTVVGEEACVDFFEGCARMLPFVIDHRVTGAVVDLEVVATGFCAELHLAAVEERGPFGLVEAARRVDRDVDAQTMAFSR